MKESNSSISIKKFEIKRFISNPFNLFSPSVAFHIENNHFICSASQVTDFYMKYNTWLKYVNFQIPYYSVTSCSDLILKILNDDFCA